MKKKPEPKPRIRLVDIKASLDKLADTISSLRYSMSSLESAVNKNAENMRQVQGLEQQLAEMRGHVNAINPIVRSLVNKRVMEPTKPQGKHHFPPEMYPDRERPW